MTASAHVLVFRPLIEILRGRGDEVEITAREYAQTLQLLELHGLEAEVIGQHGGRSRTGKARAMWSRIRALRRWAKGRDFDVALAHGSHELTMTAKRLGIPSSTTFDYEFAWLQHQLGCRAATKVVVPDAIPPDRLGRTAWTPPKLLQYAGLKEEYYLSDFEPDRSVLDDWQLDPDARARRAPPAAGRLALPPAREPALPADARVPRQARRRARVRPARGPTSSASSCASLDLPSVIVPERAVDAQSLIAFADLVVSAGGTMNREAAALGVPVYTTYGGRLGGVDEALIREGRLMPLTDPRALELRQARPALKRARQAGSAA